MLKGSSFTKLGSTQRLEKCICNEHSKKKKGSFTRMCLCATFLVKKGSKKGGFPLRRQLQCGGWSPWMFTCHLLDPFRSFLHHLFVPIQSITHSFKGVMVMLFPQRRPLEFPFIMEWQGTGQKSSYPASPEA